MIPTQQQQINTSNKKQKSHNSLNTNRLTPSEKRLIAWGKRIEKRNNESGILLEGDKLINEAMVSGHPLEAVWFTDAYNKVNPALIAKLLDSEVQVRQINGRIMRELTELETPPGIVAVAPQPHFIFRKPGDPFSLIIVLSLVQDPGNLGNVIRTADYFGIDEVWIGKGSADPYRPKVLRGAMGASFRVPVVRPSNLVERLQSFQRDGADVWVAVAHDKNAKMAIAMEGRRILVIGGESSGLSSDIIKVANHKVKIPGARRGESLNLGVAAGILIYNATAGRWRGDV